MLWGFFKKVVIADRLAVIVDNVYGDPSTHSGPTLMMATIFFGYRIYCDFSGYSDIAIGAARVLGFQLMTNFDRPYDAASVSEFWRRWHISLSTWFRDYLYLPLGGNRVSAARWTFNILFVFAVSGLWHGARWSYVLWGSLHGLLLLIERFSAGGRTRLAHWSRLDRFPRLCRGLATATTFTCVTLAWVLFRADDLSHACVVYRAMLHGWSRIAQWTFFSEARDILGVWPREGWLCVGLIAFLEIVQATAGKEGWQARIARQPLWVRWTCYSAGLWAIFLFGVLTQKEFIYFVF